MKFRTHYSFNVVDTTIVRRGNRYIVETGLLQRCKAIMRVMRDRNLRGISDIRERLSEHYRYQDLYYAATRLRAAGILVHNGYGRWQMVLRGEQIWNEQFPQHAIRNIRVVRPASQAARMSRAG